MRVPAYSGIVFGERERIQMDLISSSPELGYHIFTQELGVGAGHIDVQPFVLHETKQHLHKIID